MSTYARDNFPMKLVARLPRKMSPLNSITEVTKLITFPCESSSTRMMSPSSDTWATMAPFIVDLLHARSAGNVATTLFVKLQRVIRSSHGDLDCRYINFGHEAVRRDIYSSCGR